MPDHAVAHPTRRWSLDVLRIISIIGVIAIHVCGNMVGNSDVSGSVRWWVAVAVDLGFVWVVPVFVMISGALLLEPRQFDRGPAPFYRRRLLRLGPAFVFWPIFYVFVVHPAVTGQPGSWRSFVLGVIDGRSYTHLYFLWLIVGLYVIAPVLAAFLRDGGKRRAYIFAGAVLAVTVASLVSSNVLTTAGYDRSSSQTAVTQWVPYVGFFLAGWALRDLILRGWRLAAAALITMAAIALIIVQYGTRGTFPYLDALLPVSYYGPVVVIAALGCYVTANGALAGWQPGRMTGVVRTLSDSSFGVFLIHFAVMLAVRAIPALSDTASSLPSTFAVWGIVTVLSFALVILARRVPGVRRLV
ncbi:acyltransferase [Microbacterium hydrocarbonoxydans]|uniref:Surface polysaccharide O-acyltransferase, integral membrane enzyme n=1 Tax=Microbacterium hydrocarbonoxydans TaxID=273678 RepID=A0A1H4NK26_9MICO|nr:acyltransferase [Microbacterium hydrocarbonoxydans]SEB95597.1 Surface polysaccharide O-acyltransferase, integral membrane enzyme [Microbacterium hydrocarbonoxydans]